MKYISCLYGFQNLLNFFGSICFFGYRIVLGMLDLGFSSSITNYGLSICLFFKKKGNSNFIEKTVKHV